MASDLNDSALLGASISARAQGNYRQLHYPGASDTVAMGINSNGDAVGYYLVAGPAHGFLYAASSDTYITIDYPNASDTYLEGINDSGQIVGWASGGIGFRYDVASQSFSLVNFPGSIATYPRGINNPGEVVGWYDAAEGSFYGFELGKSTYAGINPPAAARSMANGISQSGLIVGVVPRSAHTINFFAQQGRYKKSAVPGVPVPTVEGINPQGTALVGYSYSDGSASSSAFVWQNGTVQLLTYPGSSATAAYGVNSSGVVVGIYYDELSRIFGFMWSPQKNGIR